MNQKELLIRRREALNELDRMKNIGINCCKYNSHSSDQHEDAKWRLFKHFRRANKDVVTEAIFKNGSRCDILCPDNMTIYEILSSETLKSCQVKIGAYPGVFNVIMVDTDLKVLDRRVGLL